MHTAQAVVGTLGGSAPQRRYSARHRTPPATMPRRRLSAMRCGRRPCRIALNILKNSSTVQLADLLLTTYYLPLTTYYLLLITCYVLFITCYLLLVTHYLLLITYYLLLIT